MRGCWVGVFLLIALSSGASAKEPPSGESAVARAAANAFPQRARALKPAKAKGLDAAQRAAMEALRWLAAHQSPDGRWSATKFGHWCDGKPQKPGNAKKEGHGQAVYDIGLTGLALQAFLAAGYTQRGKHRYADVIGKGLAYLVKRQDRYGGFGKSRAQQWIYNHAMATLAVVEAAGMTGSQTFLRSAQRALDFAAAQRNPDFVWRYGLGQKRVNDTHISSWLVLVFRTADMVNAAATKSGKPAPFKVDAAAYGGMSRWLDRVTDPDYGTVGYLVRGAGPARVHSRIHDFPADYSQSLTAAGVFVRHLLGDGKKHRVVIKRGLKAMSYLLPQWKSGGHIDLMYWHWGSLATWQVGGTEWKAWQKALESAVVPKQRSGGTFCRYRGSWDPIDPWSPEGGRVYATAIICTSLLAAARYERTPPH